MIILKKIGLLLSPILVGVSLPLFNFLILPTFPYLSRDFYHYFVAGQIIFYISVSLLLFISLRTKIFSGKNFLFVGFVIGSCIVFVLNFLLLAFSFIYNGSS